MFLMQVNHLYKSFGAEEILKDIQLHINKNDKIAIVGKNGTGKSTLLKILAGELTYDKGEIIKAKDIRVGYLSQHSGLESQETVWNEMLKVFQPLIEMKKELQLIEKEMKNSEKTDQILLKKYDRLLQKFQSLGGYEFEAKIRSILSGLDFPDDVHDQKIYTLSGGQKTRLALGKLLLEKPDLLILDEPTNHLDITTLSWLEGHLNHYDGALIIVSHDRYFLEQTVSIIYELSFQTLKRYVGGYQKFLEQRKKDYEIQLKKYKQQQKEIERAEQFIQRNIARASTTGRAQSRRKQLEKMERIEKPILDSSSASFSFEIERRSGDDVLKLEQVSFAYPSGEKLFSQISFSVKRRNRMALIGPNGVGKTTLLKLITKNLTPTEGTIEYGTKVDLAYYTQEQEDLTPINTVLDELWQSYPHVKEREIRTVLGNFLFSGDEVLKPVSTLSGGEKARLSLAKLMMKKANVLILDEPTNHLDIDSKEVLETALIDYPGTIIFVSHDRYFINKLATHVIELKKDGVNIYLGNYEYYVQKKKEKTERMQLQKGKRQIEKTGLESKRKLAFEERKRIQREERRRKRTIQKLEQKIEEKEQKLNILEKEMTKPEVFQDYEKSLELSKEAENIRENINKLLEKWEQLH